MSDLLGVQLAYCRPGSSPWKGCGRELRLRRGGVASGSLDSGRGLQPFRFGSGLLHLDVMLLSPAAKPRRRQGFKGTIAGDRLQFWAQVPG